MQQAQTLVPRLTSDQRSIIAAVTELQETIAGLHWGEVDEVAPGWRAWCSCQSVGFPKRDTVDEAEADLLTHYSRS